MKFFFLLIFSASIIADYSDYTYSDKTSSYNSFGQVGLIQTPTANSKDEGTIAITLNRNDIWKFGTLTVSPFNWLEASYFYYRPSDLIWAGDNIPGHELDKGFNVKFKFSSKNKNLPEVAVGLDDFAGTGYFTREYIVTTKEFRSMKASLGVGWGKYAGNNSYKNPLSFIASSTINRPQTSDNYGKGGTLSYDKWFRGNASLFGGVEFFIPKTNGLKLKVEYDPYDYFDFSSMENRPDALYDLRKKDSNINFGLSYPINKYITLETSYIKGNTFNLSLIIGLTFNNNTSSKPKFEPNIKTVENKTKSKLVFYEDLLSNLNSNRLLLQTASLSNKKVDILISSADHRNAIRSSSYAAQISNTIANLHDIDINLINISHINAGIELNNITYVASHLDKDSFTPLEVKRLYTQTSPGNSDNYKKHEFKPNVIFPAIFTQVNPAIVSYIGNPERFYFGGLDLQTLTEIQFSRNLLLTSEINYSIYNNFQDTVSGPGSKMEHVRTDKVQYLKEANLYIKRLQLDYIWSPYENIYAKISGGLFESMFGGFGGQVLYKPFNNNFTLGAESFYVRQRDYKQLFDFRDYRTSTSHINASYLFPMGVEANLSFGRYLAKDDGYTLDISRSTKSGFKAGIYFSRTNVSAELFGEGSFDKGFYWQIPLDILSSDYRGGYSAFKLSPLTRDGGAKLMIEKDLRGMIFNSTSNELNTQWNDGYLN